MKKFFIKTYPLFLLILTFLACGKKDWREEMQKEQEAHLREVARTNAFLLEFKNDNYFIPNSSTTLDYALLRFFREAKNQDDPERIETLMSEKELREIFYPNVLGTGTALDSTPFPEYEEMIRGRRKLGLVRFQEASEKDNWFRIEFKVADTRIYGPIKGHKISEAILIGKKRTKKTEAVKMVIEHKGQFKVAILGP